MNFNFDLKKIPAIFLIFLSAFVLLYPKPAIAEEPESKEPVSKADKTKKAKEPVAPVRNEPVVPSKLVKAYESPADGFESSKTLGTEKKSIPSVDASNSVLQSSIVKPEKSYIYNSIMPRPISGRELPLGYQPVPYQHTFTPEGLRSEPPGYLPTPRGYYEKEPGRLEPTRGYSENPRDFIEKDNHPVVNNSETLRIETDNHPVANLKPSLRIPNEDRPEANKDPRLRISRDVE